MPYPISDIEPPKPRASWEVDFTEKRPADPKPLEMAGDEDLTDPTAWEGPGDTMPSVILVGIGLVVAALVGVAAWYGANAVGWGL